MHAKVGAACHRSAPKSTVTGTAHLQIRAAGIPPWPIGLADTVFSNILCLPAPLPVCTSSYPVVSLEFSGLPVRTSINSKGDDFMGHRVTLQQIVENDTTTTGS